MWQICVNKLLALSADSNYKSHRKDYVFNTSLWMRQAWFDTFFIFHTFGCSEWPITFCQVGSVKCLRAIKLQAKKHTGRWSKACPSFHTLFSLERCKGSSWGGQPIKKSYSLTNIFWISVFFYLFIQIMAFYLWATVFLPYSSNPIANIYIYNICV